jgi:hypothetical protein
VAWRTGPNTRAFSSNSLIRQILRSGDLCGRAQITLTLRAKHSTPTYFDRKQTEHSFFFCLNSIYHLFVVTRINSYLQRLSSPTPSFLALLFSTMAVVRSLPVPLLASVESWPISTSVRPFAKGEVALPLVLALHSLTLFTVSSLRSCFSSISAAESGSSVLLVLVTAWPLLRGPDFTPRPDTMVVLRGGASCFGWYCAAALLLGGMDVT